jgi:hypothetical protein
MNHSRPPDVLVKDLLFPGSLAGRSTQIEVPKVSTQTELEPVDLSKYAFAPECDSCGAEATVIGQGCGDSAPVLLCDKCLERALEVIRLYVRTWQRCNKQVMICGRCYRPVLTLDTHLEVKRLNPGHGCSA